MENKKDIKFIPPKKEKQKVSFWTWQTKTLLELHKKLNEAK